ncbi:MAG: hypothetical protein R6V03_01555 [Kiritimatiellia bacterium]
MLKYILMVVLCVIAGGAMAFILMWFFRRLNRIERDRWGDKT